jgi:hypothetical protein
MTVRLSGQAVDQSNRPLQNVTILAVDAATRATAAQVKTDASGRFELRLPRRVHDFAAVAGNYVLVGLAQTPAGQLRFVMAPREAAARDVSGLGLAVGDGSAAGGDRVEVIRGQLLDPTGAGLAGVRVTFFDVASRDVAATVTTGAGGRFETALAAGSYRLHVATPGLRLARVERRDRGEWRLHLEIAGRVEEVQVRAPRNAIGDPDYPGPAERARIRFNGGTLNPYPRVRPALADTRAQLLAGRSETDRQIHRLREQMGQALPDAALLVSTPYAVARQPLGEYCFSTSHCSQAGGPAVCCTAEGTVEDQVAGTCRLAKDCVPARARP